MSIDDEDDFDDGGELIERREEAYRMISIEVGLYDLGQIDREELEEKIVEILKDTGSP